MKKTFSFLLFISILVSCSKEDLSVTSDKEAIMGQLEFLDDFPKTTNSQDEYSPQGIRVRIARPKKDCKKGIGFCRIKSNPNPEIPDPITTLGLEKTLAVHSDSKGNYVQLLFANEVPSELNNTDLLFYIDNDLETKVGEFYYSIKKKTIEADKSLGAFGGYKIYFD
ncbi:MAG TPA: hypothetical protein VK021_13670 [Flavobacteriaceae bacterium]|nr:hypothetical protein [Flavobacteriaceae bacterium]